MNIVFVKKIVIKKVKKIMKIGVSGLFIIVYLRFKELPSNFSFGSTQKRAVFGPATLFKTFLLCRALLFLYCRFQIKARV